MFLQLRWQTDHVNFAMEDIILDKNSRPTFDNPGEDSGKLKSNIANPRNHLVSPDKKVKRSKSIVNEVFLEKKPKTRRRGLNFNNNDILSQKSSNIIF